MLGSLVWCIFHNRIAIVTLFFISFFPLHGKIIRVDQYIENGVDYTSIHEACAVSVAGSGDTIQFVGSDIDTFSGSVLKWNSDAHHQPNITFLGSSSNPDSFPVLDINWQSNYWTNTSGTVYLKRVKIRNSTTIILGGHAGRKLVANDCIFQEYNKNIFQINGILDDSLFVISNCIFTNITAQIIPDIPTISTSPSGPYGIINNCTFYNIQQLSQDNLQYPATDSSGKKFVLITNSIFNRITSLSSDYKISRYYTNCLLTASQSSTNWGSGCVFSNDPKFIDPYSNGLGFKLTGSSLAINKAGTNSTNTDIANRNRFSPDIGAFEYVAGADNITLSNSSISENSAPGTILANITVYDIGSPGLHTFQLLGTDSSAFSISNNQLIAKNSFNFESKNSYSISIKAINQHNLSYTKQFTISVTNLNDPPSGITLTNVNIPENTSIGSLICTLRTIDEDVNSTHIYSFVDNSPDNALFSIQNNLLSIQTVSDYETRRNYFIRIQTNDGTASFQKSCTLYVTDVNDALTGITLSNNTILENKPIGTFVGNLSPVDQDIPATPTSFSFVTGEGSADNGSFSIYNDSLLSNAVFNYNTKASYSIRIKAVDTNKYTYEKQFTINIGAPPSISIQPINKTVGINKSTSFSITAVGPGPLSYSWRRPDLSPEQGNTAELVIPNVPIELDNKAYYCIVSNEFGKDTSVTCSLKVITLPVITAHPQNKESVETGAVTFTIEATGQNLSYRWFKNGDTLSSVTATQILTNVSYSDNGDSIWCVVTNDAGSVRSNSAIINVFSKPQITAQPVNTAVSDGDSAFFSVSATGTATLQYQWYKNSTLVSNAVSSRFAIPAVSMSDSSSSFYCIVTNPYGSATSITVTLTVTRSSPKITIQPKTITITDGDTGYSFVSASGTPLLTYSWYRIGSIPSISSSDTLWFKSPEKLNDSGSSYYCIISNNKGSISTDTIQLLVGAVSPNFLVNPPLTKTAYIGDTVLVVVFATGTKPLTYTWKKVEDINFSQNGDTLKIVNSNISDSGSYYCVASNSVGTVNSSSMKLTVSTRPIAPHIIRQPRSIEIVKGDSAVFTISVTGNPTPLYQWLINNIAINGANDSILVLKGISDSISKINCIISNTVDTICSDIVTLKVYSKPKAQFSVNTLTGPESTTIVFSDSSKGAIISWLWNFGDNTTSTEKNPTHIYPRPGIYTISLKVSTDSINTDSISIKDLISIYQHGYNPVRINAQYLNDRNVMFTLSHLSEVDISPPIPIADSLGIWIKANSLPLNQNEKLLYTFNKSIFTSDLFKDTIAIPGSDSLYGLTAGIFYNDNQYIRFDSLNGTLVLMKDTSTPANPLTIQSKLIGGDSVRFIITKPSDFDLDTTRLDSVFISFATDKSHLSIHNNNVKSFSIHEFASKMTVNQFTTVIQSGLFKSSNTEIYYAVTLKGKNCKTNQTPISSFSTNTGNKENPISLNGNAVSPSVVQIHWTKIIDSSVIAIRIFYSVNEIPIGMIYPPFAMDTIRPYLSDTIARVKNLNSNTIYFFGAQVQKKIGDNAYAWTPVTDASSRKIKTLEPDSKDSIVNSINKTFLSFDTNAAAINLSWCLKNENSDTLHVGIVFSNVRFPELLSDPQIIATKNNCETIVMNLRNPILFDTTYFVSLWLRKPNGPWAQPTIDSKGSIKIPPFIKQPVVLFNEGIDTVRVNNSKILLWRDQSFPSATPVNATIVAFDSKDGYPGMIASGQGFRFQESLNIPEFYIGVRYILPPNYQDSDIRIYRAHSDGMLSLEHTFSVDKLNKVIFIKTKNLSYPFIPLIDTLPPVLTILTDTASAINTNIMLIDSIKVDDNIKNLLITHKYSRGDEIAGTVLDTFSPKSGAVINLKIQPNVITNLAGLRSSIRISDGRSSFEANTSRKVKRSSSDEGVTEAMQWRPVFVTADLKTKVPNKLFSNFLKTDTTKYDNKYIRLFRWYPTEKNISTPLYKWVEYSDSVSELFSFTPGKLTWLKTKDAKAYNFGEGTTVSLKDSFSIKLPSKEWTDIALPFKFSSSVQQILTSSPGADKLQYYQWENDMGHYKTSVMFVPGLPVKGVILDKDNVFSIYNPAESEMIIKIPPIPVNPIDESKLLKAQIETEWWVKVQAHLDDSSSIPALYCGYSPNGNIHWYPAPPSFSHEKLNIFDRSNNKIYGHYIEKDDVDGIAKELVFQNESDQTQIFNFKTEKIGAFPQDFNTSLLNITTKEWKETGTVSVSPHGREYRWLVTGNDFYRESFLNKSALLKYTLHTLYPNPARSFVNIRFSVPFSSKENLDFSIYDVLGRRVWHKIITKPLICGNHNIIWNGHNQQEMQVQSGMYVVVFKVTNETGITIHKFESHLTYFP